MRIRLLGGAMVWLCAATFAIRSAPAQAPDARRPAHSSDSTGVLSRSIRIDIHQSPLPQAIDAIARAGDFRVSYSADLMPAGARVSLSRESVRVDDALDIVLAGTGLRYHALRGGLVVIGPRSATSAVRVGSVRDAVTGMPIRDALVSTETGSLAVSDPFGDFRLTAAPNDRLTVKRLGYEPGHAVVPAERDARLIVQLRPAVITMDRVIVMGSSEGSRERSYPGALTVIGGDELARLDLRRLEDVFSGMVPGVVAWDDGPMATTATLGSIRGSSSFTINYFKTYVDGVEIAAPFIGAGVDPATVERIEIIRGPQGAALYGSDASSGVVQITTNGMRAGTAPKPRLTIAASRGAMNSRFIEGAVPVHGYEGTVDGRLRAVTYSLGGTTEMTGPTVADIPAWWGSDGRPAPGATPTSGGAAESRSLAASTHFVAGALSGAVSYRSSLRAAGPTPNPVAMEQGFPIRHFGASTRSEARRGTSSASVRFAPVPWWSLRAIGGHDETVLASPLKPVPFLSAADSVVAAAVGTSGRRSLRVSSEFRTSAGGILGTTVTLGVERARSSHATDADSGNVLTVRDWATGAFAQTNVAVANILFLTAGLRSEANTGFGADRGAVTLPLLGAALVHGHGDLTVKLRAAYGKGIRPPPPGAASAGVVHSWRQLPNDDLGPESQRGTEYGVDVHLASHTRLHATVFDQVADGLIQLVPVSVQTQLKTVQQQNIGAIANRGWEIEGSTGGAGLRMSGYYSRTSSRVQSVARRYSGSLRAGDRMLEVPSWSAGFTSTAGVGPFTVAATVWRVGDWVSYDWITLYRTVFAERRPPGPVRDYWITYPGFTQVRAAASARVWRETELVLRGENLTNEQNAGRDNLHVSTGRTIMLGVRARF